MPECRHDPPQPDTCIVCCLINALPAEANPSLASAATYLKLSCFHLGKVIDYQGCGCPMKHIHQCDIFGTCTLDRCQTCPRYIYDGPDED